ncbi:helix-turn-helix transcriptional regulator [Lysinibacillus sp. FSL P4-0201]|uniref:helix-turn-helix transcriptional regulator n=1 Tax=Lysinibacillus TaxID=400634 RepID=UPI003159DE1F
MLNKEKIGQILTDLRGEASREEVAKAVGVSVSAWQMYENGQRIPKDEVKVRIASYFKKTVGEIFYS